MRPKLICAVVRGRDLGRAQSHDLVGIQAQFNLSCGQCRHLRRAESSQLGSGEAEFQLGSCQRTDLSGGQYRQITGFKHGDLGGA